MYRYERIVEFIGEVAEVHYFKSYILLSVDTIISSISSVIDGIVSSAIDEIISGISSAIDGIVSSVDTIISGIQVLLIELF